jgi:predicted small integral membrane protein
MLFASKRLPVLQFQQLFGLRRRISLLADDHTPLCWFGINGDSLGW